MGDDGRDDWDKPRTRRDHFTEEERDFIRQQFRAGATPKSVARALKAARRTIAQHYTKLKTAELNTTTVSSANYSARLYKSDFEL